MGDLSEYFSSKEFSCHCGCGAAKASPEIINLLEIMRRSLGHPLLITSGTRCEAHNKKVGGVSAPRTLQATPQTCPP